MESVYKSWTDVAVGGYELALAAGIQRQFNLTFTEVTRNFRNVDGYPVCHFCFQLTLTHVTFHLLFRETTTEGFLLLELKKIKKKLKNLKNERTNISTPYF